MTRLACIGLAAVILAASSGCSFFGRSHQLLRVDTHREADILVDGAKVGKGNVTVNVPRDRNHVVMARLGDDVMTAGVGHRLSTLGILDIIGGFLWLVPFLGLASPGAYSLDQETVTLHIK